MIASEKPIKNLPSMMKDIADFHEKFKLAYQGSPRDLPLEIQNFRIRFMDEELDEYRHACIGPQLDKQLDALVDLVYVALGTAHLQGFDFNEAWRRVHAANMAKVRTPAPTERGGGFDVVKPAGWVAPDLTDLVTP